MATQPSFYSLRHRERVARDHLVGQDRNENSPFLHRDVGEGAVERCGEAVLPVPDQCCHDLMAMISRSTWDTDGQLWEVGCALDEGVPVLGIYTTKYNCPAALQRRGVTFRNWSWANIDSSLDKL